VAATDLEVGARVTVPATIVRPGAITLAARKLLELVRELPAQPVTLKLQENGWVQLLCGTATFRLVGLPAEEYPPIETGEADAWVTVDAARLRTMLARTSFAMSQDESRPFLNGLYLLVRKGELRLVATDGHRLALARTGVETDAEMSGIVPRKAVLEIGRVLGGSEEATLAVRENQFYLRTPGFSSTTPSIVGGSAGRGGVGRGCMRRSPPATHYHRPPAPRSFTTRLREAAGRRLGPHRPMGAWSRDDRRDARSDRDSRGRDDRVAAPRDHARSDSTPSGRCMD
jgi:DNA polymerase III beta subunit, central domain/DNA polymerase III beta subunit, N-terminal domain